MNRLRPAVLTAAALVAAAVLSGCGGSANAPAAASTAGTSTTAASTPSPTPSPTPTILTKKQAAARYLAIDAAYTKARKRLSHDLDGTLDYKKIRKDGAAAEKALARKISLMSDVKWPRAIQKYADSYESKAALGVDTFRQVAHAHDFGDLATSGSASTTQRINGAEVLLRIKLGLPQKQN